MYFNAEALPTSIRCFSLSLQLFLVKCSMQCFEINVKAKIQSDLVFIWITRNLGIAKIFNTISSKKVVHTDKFILFLTQVTEYLGVARMLDVYSSQTASQMAAPQLGLCPICGQNVLLSDLEVHADRCASSLD